MNCPKCGNIINEGITNCPICGEPVVNMSMPQTTEQPVPSAVPPVTPTPQSVPNAVTPTMINQATSAPVQTAMPGQTVQPTPVAESVPTQAPVAPQTVSQPAPTNAAPQPIMNQNVSEQTIPTPEQTNISNQDFGIPTPTPMNEINNITPDLKVDPNAERIKDKKNLSIIIIAAVILALIVGTYVVTRPHKGTTSTNNNTTNTNNNNTQTDDKDKKDDNTKQEEKKTNNTELGSKVIFDNKDEYGNIYYILNNNTSNSEIVDITIKLFDTTNTVIKEEKIENVYVSANSNNGDRHLIDTSIQYATYKIELKKSLNPNTYKDYSTSAAYTVTPNENGLSATWTNNTENTLEVHATLIYYKDDQIIGFESDNVNFLTSGSESTLNFYSPYGSKYKSLEYNNYKLFINAHNF